MANFTLGIGELGVTKAPNTLTTLGLGSCVGIVLYDRYSKIGGMAHIMLPKAPAGAVLPNPAKYADTGFDALLKAMQKAGANIKIVTAKLAGGAHMFSSTMGNDVMKVGQRNVEIVHQLIKSKAIPIVAEETGGTVGAHHRIQLRDRGTYGTHGLAKDRKNIIAAYV